MATGSAGHVFPDKEVTIHPHRVEEYVEALGVAPEEGWAARPGAPLPPGFLMYVTMYGADDVHDVVGLDFRRAFYGGMDEEFFHPVRVGDTVRLRASISDVSTRAGSDGELTFTQVTCEYHLPDGTLAVRERSTLIQRA